MTTRFDAKDEKNYGVSGINSGYDGLKSDLSIPSCGIEDVDVALFNLFDKEIRPAVGGQDSSELKKVPIIFAAGEKWALLKNGRPIRDKTNTLILPLITIMRKTLTQQQDDITGRGINQQTGEIVVKRRLDSSDRNYQNLINKFFILNQTNVAVSGSVNLPSDQLTTARKIGKLENSQASRSGALLSSSRKNNIFETIVLPSPQFYTAMYDVTIWTQYTQHMNQIIEKLVSSFLPQAQSWKLTTPKGYWFIASVEGGDFNIETNFDDMSSAERYIKSTISIKVPAYVFASSAPGVPVPVKRYVSSPIVDFNVATRSADEADEKEGFPNNLILGSDDPTLPLDEQGNAREDQRRPGWRTQVVQPSNSVDKIDANDPALKNLPRGIDINSYRKVKFGNEIRYVKILNVNSSNGETVYSSLDFTGLDVIPVESV